MAWSAASEGKARVRAVASPTGQQQPPVSSQASLRLKASVAACWSGLANWMQPKLQAPTALVPGGYVAQGLGRQGSERGAAAGVRHPLLPAEWSVEPLGNQASTSQSRHVGDSSVSSVLGWTSGGHYRVLGRVSASQPERASECAHLRLGQQEPGAPAESPTRRARSQALSVTCQLSAAAAQSVCQQQAGMRCPREHLSCCPGHPVPSALHLSARTNRSGSVPGWDGVPAPQPQSGVPSTKLSGLG